jgi:AraC-like DNA-binding protein
MLEDMGTVIGKTRQGARIEQVFDARAGRPRGILTGAPAEGAFRHSRRDPPEALAPWIEHFWSVQWDLRGCEPFLAETIPHPNVHVTLEPDGSRVGGVRTRKFSSWLKGQGWVFGTKFKAGAFRPFLGRAVSSIRDKVIPGEEVFGPALDALREGLRWDGEEEARLAAASAFWLERVPAADATAQLAADCVRLILDSRELGSVEELAARSGVSKRSLQRLFQEYVGVPVKWVIRRYRLHDVVEAIQAGGPAPDWARLAVDLGYFDQSHMINDFRSITGYAPARLARSGGQIEAEVAGDQAVDV